AVFNELRLSYGRVCQPNMARSDHDILLLGHSKRSNVEAVLAKNKKQGERPNPEVTPSTTVDYHLDRLLWPGFQVNNELDPWTPLDIKKTQSKQRGDRRTNQSVCDTPISLLPLVTFMSLCCTYHLMRLASHAISQTGPILRYYEKLMPGLNKSKELHVRASRVIPGGVNSPVRAFRSVGSVP